MFSNEIYFTQMQTFDYHHFLLFLSWHDTQCLYNIWRPLLIKRFFQSKHSYTKRKSRANTWLLFLDTSHDHRERQKEIRYDHSTVFVLLCPFGIFSYNPIDWSFKNLSMKVKSETRVTLSRTGSNADGVDNNYDD